MDQICWNKDVVAGMASYYFIGWAIGSILIWIPDRVGRLGTMKKFLIPVAFIALQTFMISTSYNVRCAIFFVLGMAKLKTNLTVVTAFEHMPKAQEGMSGTIIFGFESCIIGITCLYFQFIGRDSFQFLQY